MADLTVSSAVDTFMAAANQAAMLSALNITLGGAFATSGAFTTTFTVTGNTNVTLPTAGTLAILGANIFAAAQTINVNGAASVSPLLLSGTIMTGGTGTTNFPNLLIQPTGATASTTWNTSGTAFGINLNINAGNFVDFCTDGASKFRVNSTGSMNVFASIFCDSGFIAGTGNWRCDSYGTRMVSTGYVGWCSGSPEATVADTFLLRKTASPAVIQMGQDSAGVTNQMFTAASRITSDGIGATLTIAGGNGRGGAGGSLIFSYYTTAAAATIGTLTEAMRINTLGQIVLNNLPTSDPGVVGALYRTAGAVMISV